LVPGTQEGPKERKGLKNRLGNKNFAKKFLGEKPWKKPSQPMFLRNLKWPLFNPK